MQSRSIRRSPAHWYDGESFSRLIAACVADDLDHGRDRTVRDFIAEFRGLARTDDRAKVLDSVGAAGQLLDRSIVDRMVGSPERFSFEAAPDLVPPVAQDAGKRRPRSFDGYALATALAAPPMTIADKARLWTELKTKAAAALASEAAEARDSFIVKWAKKLAHRGKVSIQEARRIVARQCDGVLLPGIELPFDDSSLAGCTVGDILANPARFCGETLADPLEGIGYGRCKAMVMRRANGDPWIHSFAHGRTVYELRYDATAVRAAVTSAPKAECMRTKKGPDFL